MEGSPNDPIAVIDESLNPSELAKLKAESLSEKLQTFIASLPSGGVTLAEIRDLVGQDGLLLLIAFLTLVFLIPISIPGVSTVFGFGILLIGISRLSGRTLWLPKFVARRVLPADKLRAALNHGSKWLHRLERISRSQRLPWLASSRVVGILNNSALIAGALLLMAPFGFVPFTNTLPALGLLFLSIGLLQHDGLCILFGHLANLGAVIYFTILLVGGGTVIRGTFRRLFGAL